jgi:predicted DNA repair protein MutK
MASGLAALMDDVAAIARMAAASLDDVAAASAKAGSKAVGVVIDDAAVTPQYAQGLAPARELPIIWKIAKGSIFNKLVILLPAALLLSAFAPFAITPILMLGGTYLCFEGAEKVLELLGLHGGHEHGGAGVDDHADAGGSETDPAALEATMAKGAIRTDLILSGEIMAIALADVAARPLSTQVMALMLVALAITVLVYGAVGLIVKMDDIGLHLAQRPGTAVQAVGRALVRAMPLVLSALSGIGMVAMLWVGGGIVLHGLEQFHLGALPHALHDLAHSAGELVPFAQGFVVWLVGALGAALFGLVLGSGVAMAVTVSAKLTRRG